MEYSYIYACIILRHNIFILCLKYILCITYILCGYMICVFRCLGCCAMPGIDLIPWTGVVGSCEMPHIGFWELISSTPGRLRSSVCWSGISPAHRLLKDLCFILFCLNRNIIIFGVTLKSPVDDGCPSLA